jgi:hypothetical protein
MADLTLNPGLALAQAQQKAAEYLDNNALREIREGCSLGETQKSLLFLQGSIDNNTKDLDLRTNKQFDKALLYLEQNGFVQKNQRYFEGQEIHRLQGAISTAIRIISPETNTHLQDARDYKQKDSQITKISSLGLQNQNSLLSTINSNSRPTS